MVDASAVIVASVVVALAVGAGVSAVAVAIFGASSFSGCYSPRNAELSRCRRPGQATSWQAQGERLT
jgi:hypothetical protein